MKYKCETCEFETDKTLSFCWHIRKIHKLSTKEYYLKYILKQDSEPKCKNPQCNNITYFKDFTKGYCDYCCKKCHNSHFYSLPENIEKMMNNMKNTNIEKYGVPHCSQDKNIKEKIKINTEQSMLNKYGVSCPFSLKEVQEKIKQTNLKNLGVENPLMSKNIQEKIKNTNIKNHGTPYVTQTEECKLKIAKTRNNKSLEEKLLIIEKRKLTNNKKYGGDSPCSASNIMEKIKQTNIEKYGGISPAHSPEIIEKTRTTCLKRYGVTNPMDDETISKRWKENLYKRKEYILPSGKIIKLQGYEPEALDQILIYVLEKDIEFDNIPYIAYTYGNKTLKYYPDLYIKSLNLIIEVKSTYVLKKQGIQKNEEKFKACKARGFNFLLILDNNFEELEKYLKINQ